MNHEELRYLRTICPQADRRRVDNFFLIGATFDPALSLAPAASVARENGIDFVLTRR